MAVNSTRVSVYYDTLKLSFCSSVDLFSKRILRCKIGEHSSQSECFQNILNIINDYLNTEAFKQNESGRQSL